MIGYLPKTLEVKGREFVIRTDFRPCLDIMCLFDDDELETTDKVAECLRILFGEDEIEFIFENAEEAYDKARIFLNCGKEDNTRTEQRIVDFEQDSQLIFSGVNKMLGYSVRELEYLHWWDFCGYLQELTECTYSYVLSIRKKKKQNKKLDDQEKKFYQENKSIVDIKEKEIKNPMTAQEEAIYIMQQKQKELEKGG